MLRLIGADEHIVANLADDFHRNIFMFRIGNGDKIRMIPLKYFPADVAATAGGISFEEIPLDPKELWMAKNSVFRREWGMVSSVAKRQMKRNAEHENLLPIAHTKFKFSHANPLAKRRIVWYTI